MDDTPYEHDFAPGDHIIRWDMLPIIWPIRIHGIVLEVSEEKSEVIICGFEITSVKAKDKAKPHRRQDLKILEEESAEFNKAIHDECVGANNGEELLVEWTTEREHGTREKRKKTSSECHKAHEVDRPKKMEQGELRRRSAFREGWWRYWKEIGKFGPAHRKGAGKCGQAYRVGVRKFGQTHREVMDVHCETICQRCCAKKRL